MTKMNWGTSFQNFSPNTAGGGGGGNNNPSIDAEHMQLRTNGKFIVDVYYGAMFSDREIFDSFGDRRRYIVDYMSRRLILKAKMPTFKTWEGD